MRLSTPFWWYRKRGAIASALAPAGRLYGHMAAKRASRIVPHRATLPVICIGNFTAGGGGKTPTAIAVASLLKSLGERPCFLTRGYGGDKEGPLLVAKGQNAEEVGDEPLLLVEHAPTVLSANRAEGARFISEAVPDATVIIMDDGFQNPQLEKDFSLIVADSTLGIGNGLLIPAGPLRAPLEEQIGSADALMLIGDGSHGASLVEAFEAAGKPVLKARMAPRGDSRWLTVLPAIGFAGIANPKKFYDTLSRHGARLYGTRSFPDHHFYTERQAARLLKRAREWNAMLVTTEKDWVRLPEEDGTPLGELRFRSRPFQIAAEFSEPERLQELLQAALRSKR